MNFLNSRQNRELTKYIIIFSDHLLEDCDEEELENILNKIKFCIEELSFWAERKNPARYQDTLRCLLKWLFDKAENNF